MPKCDFNKLFNKLQRGRSPVNLLRIFRTLFCKNNYGGLIPNRKIFLRNFLKVFRSFKDFQVILLKGITELLTA